MIALPYTYGTCHKLLTFLCGLPSRHSGERRAVEWRLFQQTADRSKAARGLPRSRSYIPCGAARSFRITSRIRIPMKSSRASL